MRAKLASRITTDETTQQVKTITHEICQILDSPNDELFLYGFSTGGYIVRGVAGMLHHMGLPKREFMSEFEEVYKNGLSHYKAWCDDDPVLGPTSENFLKIRTDGPPQIQFVGVFDSIRAVDRPPFDLSLVSSIRNFRQALAFNETRPSLAPDVLENPNAANMVGRTFVQAWFAGTHQDLAGGTEHDGLSVFPLQWMIIESIKAGLVPKNEGPSDKKDKNDYGLAVAFPQYAGGAPALDGKESIEWQLKYNNGLQVSMYDVQSVTGSAYSETAHNHSIRVHNVNTFYNTPRKIFTKEGLVGWVDGGMTTSSVFSSEC